MKFGFLIPNNWGVENSADVVDVAIRAEEMGFDSVWVSHHVLHTGFVFDRLGDRPYQDALTVLTYAAAKTRSVRLGTSVLVLPYLNPVVLAKTLATLDVLSGGRVTVGVGVGALPHEFECIGADFALRGAYTDEAIAIMKTLWTEDAPSHEGRFYRFSGVEFHPGPMQKPHPPIVIGGSSKAALRRVARSGQGWHPVGTSPDEVGDLVEYLKVQLDAHGRSVSDITISVRQELDVLDSPTTAQRTPMTGTPDQLLNDIEAYARHGVGEIALAVSTHDVSRIYRIMESFAAKVMPRARRS